MRNGTLERNRGPASWRVPWLWRAFAVLLVILVGVLSLMPSPPEPPRMLRWDKAQHLLTYLVLAWWWAQCWPRWIPAVVLGLAAYGTALEGLQALSPARMLEPGDMLANALGVLAGAVLSLGPPGRAIDWADRALQWLWRR